MSESAVILEGEVARRFNPVDKLRATNQDSSVSDWVPSDTLDLGTLMASENTLYLANIDDDCDAYEEVEVDVSTDLEDADDLTKATTKITGKDPNLDPNNDYAAGVDENGNLTKEMIPAAIHIVVKPRKLKYEEGETLDFTGIHVYLMDGNNKRYTDDNYPTGEIPFNELIFPVTTAENETGSDEYTDGHGLNVLRVTFGPETQAMWGYTFYMGPVVGFLPEGAMGGLWSDGGPLRIASKATSSAFSAYVTKYNDNLYGYGIDGFGRIAFKIDNGFYGWHESIYQNDFRMFASATSDPVQYTEFPESTVDPIGKSVDDLHPAKQTVPVQWIRSDGEILEDTFEIEIGESEEGEEQPDPWGGYADVSWGGHHYNFNRRLVPPVQYSNGYCWRQQAGEYTVEYTVEQAANMGWLILIR